MEWNVYLGLDQEQETPKVSQSFFPRRYAFVWFRPISHGLIENSGIQGRKMPAYIRTE